ncbi:AfsR/SARP family transcriptional regulator [Actinomadura sp. KC345]|uniref:AfsR/SARP family transcriptional regulator n=1 Tax=Actinomadura sp. KC345 TaxID=2530371 RepID=UPI0014044626|nr:AfsR/SARP family transcriptional regulator [Actinomadura sp. KC345]
MTAGRLRALLALLALSPGRVVTAERLASALWSEGRPPHNVRRSVQTYVSRLRSLLGPDSIASRSTGYVLQTAPESVDVLRFGKLLAHASASSDPAEERTCLSEALSLWRGDPFDGVPSPWLKESQSTGLVERYLTALERRIGLDLAAGRHRELAAELAGLVARHPLREPLWRQMIIALDRCGRRAHALAQYEVIRSRIAAELGVDPDPSLQRIYSDLLAGRALSTTEA